MAYLVLENGAVFEGERIGAPVDTLGELVFTTGVVGYMETLTDPNYVGQMVVQTFPVVGNYGVMEEDAQSAVGPCGYVVRELCDTPSNFRSKGSLDSFLKKRGIGGICGVDTREITRTLREQGTMMALICDEIPAAFPKKQSLAPVAGCREKQVFPAVGERRFSLALVDFGAKQSLIDTLCGMGGEVTLWPQDTAAEAILAADPDGVVVSDGPGDPNTYTAAVAQITALVGKKPLLGVGLGHQLLALAMGGQCKKLPFGHRGNQPIRQPGGHRTYITAQNHGYAVVESSVQGVATETFVNLNDNSCEGLVYPAVKALSVQFEPAGDTAFVWDSFVKLMGGEENA